MADPVKTFEVCPRWKVRQQLASAEHRVWQSALGLAGAWPDFQPWFLRHMAPGLWGGCRLAALGLGFTRCPGSGSRQKHGSTRWPQRVLSRHRTWSTPWEVLLSLALRNMSSTTLPCLDCYSFPGHSSGGWWPGAFLFDPVKFSSTWCLQREHPISRVLPGVDEWSPSDALILQSLLMSCLSCPQLFLSSSSFW